MAAIIPDLKVSAEELPKSKRVSEFHRFWTGTKGMVNLPPGCAETVIFINVLRQI